MNKEVKRENGTLRVMSVPVGESKTEQSHKKGVNINTIIAKARKGIPARIQSGEMLYGNFATGLDFHTMMNRIEDAKLDFMSLPAKTRERFDNDPGKLLDFISDPENIEEARELNLLPKEEPEAPVVAADPPAVPAEPEAPSGGSEPVAPPS